MAGTSEIAATSRSGRCAIGHGTLVGKRYRLVRVLGRGAMGVVFEAEHVTVGRPVAVKVLGQEWANDPEMSARFRREARAASAAGHPNIINVLDAGDLEDGRPFLVMELSRGRPLSAVLDEEGPLQLVRACRIVRDMARGAHAAHCVGVIHRDLKPDNVLVSPPPRPGDAELVQVVDFGIAIGRGTLTRMTQPGTAIGTPLYMAPEQSGGAAPRPAFDIYAIGVVLFELLTGRPPFMSTNPVELMSMKSAETAPRLLGWRPDVPRALARLVAECLEIDPCDRPPSAAAVAERLDEIVADLVRTEPALRPAAPARKAGRWAPLPAIGGAIVLLVGAVLWATWPTTTVSAAPAVVHVVSDGPEPDGPAPDGPEPDGPEPDAPEPAPTVVVEARPEAIPEPESSPDPEPTPAVEHVRRPPRPRTEVAPSPASLPLDPAPPPLDPAPPPACDLTRRAARESRATHDWRGVLRRTKSASCWPSDGERARLRVQALMELGRFDACLRAAQGSDDEHLRRWITICERRRARSP